MNFNNIGKYLTFILVFVLLYENNVFSRATYHSHTYDYSTVNVSNQTKEPIYAAIYYNDERATEIEIITPGKIVEISLPPWKVLKTRYVLTTKNKEALKDNLKDLSEKDPLRSLLHSEEVGHGKQYNIARRVIYTGTGEVYRTGTWNPKVAERMFPSEVYLKNITKDSVNCHWTLGDSFSNNAIIKDHEGNLASSQTDMHGKKGTIVYVYSIEIKNPAKTISLAKIIPSQEVSDYVGGEAAYYLLKKYPDGKYAVELVDKAIFDSSVVPRQQLGDVLRLGDKVKITNVVTGEYLVDIDGKSKLGEDSNSIWILERTPGENGKEIKAGTFPKLKNEATGKYLGSVRDDGSNDFNPLVDTFNTGEYWAIIDLDHNYAHEIDAVADTLRKKWDYKTMYTELDQRGTPVRDEARIAFFGNGTGRFLHYSGHEKKKSVNTRNKIMDGNDEKTNRNIWKIKLIK